jgi:hypothetical protein
VPSPFLVLLENQHTGCSVCTERDQIRIPRTQEILDVSRRTVAPSNPHDLRRRPKQKRAVVEVGVLSDDRKFVLGCMAPDISIVRGFEPQSANMHQPGAEIGKTVAESVGQI